MFTKDRHSTLESARSDRLPEEPVLAASPEQIVDALHGVFGRAPAARAIHAKGVAFQGVFLPSLAAATLSKAPHLQGAPVAAVVRFSNFSGTPTAGDLEATAGPRGMAIKFRLPDGSTTDIVAHSFNGFPTRTADELRALFIAIKASSPDSPSPTPLEQFFETHSAAEAFVRDPNPPPVHYGSLPYYGVNSFKFLNATEGCAFGRYRLEPTDGVQFLSPEQKLAVGSDYVAMATRARVNAAPIIFRLRVQLADASDVIDDPSTAWPDTRRIVELGVISITRVVGDDEAVGRELSFDPAAVPAGIEVADPMLQVRSAAYSVSKRQRTAVVSV